MTFWRKNFLQCNNILGKHTEKNQYLTDSYLQLQHLLLQITRKICYYYVIKAFKLNL